MADRLCVYCGLAKDQNEFSDEHIWPDALGGDYLEKSMWRTDAVCQRCNSLSGVFVDGAFIKSWTGSAERATGAREYLSMSRMGKGALPLHYLGRLADVKLQEGEVAEFWVGACGDNIVHFRPQDNEELWASYAGGDPRKSGRKKHAGRAYLAFASEEEFWIITTAVAFKRQFSGKRYIINAELPPAWTAFEVPDVNDPVQAQDLAVMQAIRQTSLDNKKMKAQVSVQLDGGGRFLAKLALALAYKTFGEKFLESDYAKVLRQGFREVNPQKRAQIKVMGSGYFGQAGLSGNEELLKWSGAWVLLLLAGAGKLSLIVITPAGKTMVVLVCDDSALISQLPKDVREGRVWLTIPALEEAVGPIPLATYVAHQIGASSDPELAALAAKRCDPSLLPPCKPEAK